MTNMNKEYWGARKLEEITQQTLGEYACWTGYYRIATRWWGLDVRGTAKRAHALTGLLDDWHDPSGLPSRLFALPRDQSGDGLPVYDADALVGALTLAAELTAMTSRDLVSFVRNKNRAERITNAPLEYTALAYVHGFPVYSRDTPEFQDGVASWDAEHAAITNALADTTLVPLADALLENETYY